MLKVKKKMIPWKKRSTETQAEKSSISVEPFARTETCPTGFLCSGIASQGTFISGKVILLKVICKILSQCVIPSFPIYQHNVLSSPWKREMWLVMLAAPIWTAGPGSDFPFRIIGSHNFALESLMSSSSRLHNWKGMLFSHRVMRMNKISHNYRLLSWK